MGEGERSLCLQDGGCRDSDGTHTHTSGNKQQHARFTAALSGNYI